MVFEIHKSYTLRVFEYVCTGRDLANQLSDNGRGLILARWNTSF